MALCTVCARKGVINLLNHTSLTGRLMAARNKYGGYRNKTQSTVDSGGLLIFPAVISTTYILGDTQQGYHLACHNMPSLIILVITRVQSHGHVPHD